MDFLNPTFAPPLLDYNVNRAILLCIFSYHFLLHSEQYLNHKFLQVLTEVTDVHFLFYLFIIWLIEC